MFKAAKGWWRGREPESPAEPVGQPETVTAEQDLTPVDGTLQDCAPVATGDPPYIFGSLRSAKEHAEALRAVMIGSGLVNRATWQGELEPFHREMCERLGWVPRLWDAVGRELARLPDVERGAVKLNGQRLTTYEVREPDAPADSIEPAKPATVVDLAERKRA
jgi:hypothetical protein